MEFTDIFVRFDAGAERMRALGFSNSASPRIFDVERAEQLRGVQGEGLLLVSSTNVELLRQALKGRRAPLLLMKSFQSDVGLLRDAKEHGRAFVFPVSMLLERNGIERGKLMVRMSYFLGLCVRLGVPYILASGARNAYELKSPEEMAAVGQALGLSRDQALWAISEAPKPFI